MLACLAALPLLVVFTVVLIAVLYWFFGTEKGCSLRATGAGGTYRK